MGGKEEDQDPDQEGSPEANPRATLLGERVARSLRVEPERWARCLESPEARLLLSAFLDTEPAGRLLFVTQGAAGQLALAEELGLAPTAGRSSKGVFLLRLASGPLRSPPDPRQLLYGDLSVATLDQVATLVEEVGSETG